ncbi:MAG TPA: cache domain-containing protein [Deltaproteobacteria bacterium]|nr:cache domain-containing protein [Deltaproteobacteria bacterium]
MDQEAKSSFSFASIAVSFFILIVLPLTITGVIISKGVVRVGEEATQANLRILDDSQKLSIGARAQTVADAVAQFLSDVEKDVRIASILPRDAGSYATFLKSNTRGVIESSQAGIVKIPVPVYHEIAFLNREGNTVLRVTSDGTAVAGNGSYAQEKFFVRAKGLAPGEFYMGPVVGADVSREEAAAGKRFEGVIHLASPVFDSTGFAGVIELSLNAVHLAEFTDHIMPTEPGLVFADVKADDLNYAFMVYRNGLIISHPADYVIWGYDENNQPAPVWDETNYARLSQTGEGGINVLNMGFLDENLPKIHALASEGRSGSLTYNIDETRIFVAYAPIPYYGNGFSKPQGFGWVGMIVDIDKYHNLSQEKVEEIRAKVERWQKSSIVVVFVSLILLFIIALILARGLYRSIQRAAKDTESMPRHDDED